VEKNNYCVYKHTFPNGKVYIGITSKEPEKRWKKGFGYRKSTRISNAIKKYGWENVNSEILFINLFHDDANKKERELIKLYDSRNINKGYNITEGGSGLLGYKHSKEIREKMSKALSGEKNPMFGKKTSDEVKEKIRKATSGEKNHNFGKPGPIASKEAIERRSKMVSIPVNQYDLKGNFIKYWNSTKEASRSLNIADSNICNVLKGRGHTTNGFIWKYAKNYPQNKNLEKSCIISLRYTSSKKINQFSLDGTLIKTWSSIREAARYIHPSNSKIARHRIQKRLLKVTKTKEAFGFLWEYEESSDKVEEKVV
jgi:group I intron endonuclease